MTPNKKMNAKKGKKGKDSKNFLTGTGGPSESQISCIALYLLVILGVMIFISAYRYSTVGPKKDVLFSLLIYTSCAGGLGGTISCMRGFVKHIVRGDFDVKYNLWYIFRPFISAVMGVFAFLLIYGGLIGFTGGELSGGSSLDILEETPRSVKAFYCAVAFLAGFSVDEFSRKLRDLCKILFTRLEKDWKPEEKTEEEE